MKFACVKRGVEFFKRAQILFASLFKVVLRLRLLVGLVKPSIYCRAASPKKRLAALFAGYLSILCCFERSKK